MKKQTLPANLYLLLKVGFTCSHETAYHVNEIR